ncbi:MAG: hypothetical protein NC320_09805 [Clostridium sp.]|nr:hypothetical protein [Clostridium sp.]
MYHIKLSKGLSYRGIVSATKQKPDVFTEDEDIYKKALATGYFEDVSGSEEEESDNSEYEKTSHAYGGKSLDEMNTSELETFAAYKNVSLKGIRKRDAMIDKLREELPAEELEGVIEYGSPAMTELQQ